MSDQKRYGAGTYGAGTPGWQQSMGVGAPADPRMYANWGKRAGAYLIDHLLFALTWVVVFIGVVLLVMDVHYDKSAAEAGDWPFHFEDSATPAMAVLVMLGGLVIPLVFWFYNWPFRQGRTGSTIGKSMLGIRVVSAETMRPIGFWMTWLREILHYLDGLLFCLGYLWPLWDAKRQTFADKILSTVVVPDQY